MLYKERANCKEDKKYSERNSNIIEQQNITDFIETRFKAPKTADCGRYFINKMKAGEYNFQILLVGQGSLGCITIRNMVI